MFKLRFPAMFAPDLCLKPNKDTSDDIFCIKRMLKKLIFWGFIYSVKVAGKEGEK